MAAVPKVNFKADPRMESGKDGSWVEVDGVRVGFVSKRRAVYTGMQRGGIYTYFEFRELGLDSGKPTGDPLGSDTTRKRAVAEGLSNLGMVEAALQVEPETTRFYSEKAGLPVRGKGWVPQGREIVTRYESRAHAIMAASAFSRTRNAGVVFVNDPDREHGHVRPYGVEANAEAVA